MNTRTIQRLQKLIGKVATIITVAINRNIDEIQAREMFTVRIVEVNTDGVWGQHPYNEELESFFTLQHIVTICQESELDPNSQEYKDMVSQYETKVGKKIQPDLAPPKKNLSLPILGELKKEPPVIDEREGDSNFVDVEDLERLAAFAKKSFDDMDRTNSKEPFGS